MNSREIELRLIELNGGRLIHCDRCGGSGYIPRYRHIQNGVCFKCKGAGKIVDRIHALSRAS